MIAKALEETPLFNGLKEMILTEGYRHGDVLPSEAKLMERFGCSRSSMREALKQLQTLGVVEIRRGIGTYVGPLTVAPLFEAIAVGTVVRSRSNPNAFRDLLDTRIAIDLGMAEAICSTLAGQKNETLDQLVMQMIESAENGDSFMEKDRAFHEELQSAVGNQFAVDLVISFWDVFYRMDLDSRFGTTVPITRIAQCHRDILDAAYAGDVTAYRKAVKEHYEGAVGQANLFAESYDGHSDGFHLR